MICQPKSFCDSVELLHNLAMTVTENSLTNEISTTSQIFTNYNKIDKQNGSQKLVVFNSKDKCQISNSLKVANFFI